MNMMYSNEFRIEEKWYGNFLKIVQNDYLFIFNLFMIKHSYIWICIQFNH